MTRQRALYGAYQVDCIRSGCGGLHIPVNCRETDDIQLRGVQGKENRHRIICIIITPWLHIINNALLPTT